MDPITEAGKMEPHRFNDAVGVARFQQPADLPMGFDDAMDEGGEQRIFPAGRRNASVG